MIRWYRRYRLLVVVYGVALLVGIREYRNAQGRDSPDWLSGCQYSAASCVAEPVRGGLDEDSVFWNRHARLTELVSRINPDDPDTRFLQAMDALGRRDEAEFTRLLEEALASGAKHNDMLLNAHVQYLLDSGADWREVNRAVNRWRRNHPTSTETVSLRLGEGPSTRAEAELLHRELERVSWIGSSGLERVPGEDGDRFRVHLSFVPGREVDVREAVAAVTVLSLPEEARSQYDVTCETLTDCTASPRR